MDLAEIRRQNLRNLRTKIGARRIAATLPLDQVEMLGTVCKAKSLVEPAEAFVRAVEKAFYLEPGCLDAPVGIPSKAVDEVVEIRRQHIRALMAKYGASELANRLGYRQSSFLSQMAGPNPDRSITEKSARAYEKALDLPPGYLDRPIEPPEPVAQGPVIMVPQASTADMLALVLAATRRVGEICEDEKVSLPPSKFASLLQIVCKDAIDHGGAVREDYVKGVLELVK